MGQQRNSWPCQGCKCGEGQFRVCDFNHFSIAKGSFAGTHFERCRFVSATFDDVKFSGCTFSRCHFLHARFIRCQFIDCSFDENSASPEHIRFEGTSIPAGAFLAALVANVKFLPAETTAEYQQHRHIKGVAKIASLLHFSNGYHADVELYYDAFREFQSRNLVWRIADANYEERKVGGVDRVVRRGYRSRLRALRYRSDKSIVDLSGFVTDWGRSPTHCLLMLASLVLIFAGVYAAMTVGGLTSEGVIRALDRSVSTTLVFGYSVHVRERMPLVERIVLGANATIGLFWYSMVLPVLVGRTLR